MIATRTENRYYAKAADIPPEMLAAPPTGSGELRRPVSIATGKRTITAANAMALATRDRQVRSNPPNVKSIDQVLRRCNRRPLSGDL